LCHLAGPFICFIHLSLTIYPLKLFSLKLQTQSCVDKKNLSTILRYFHINSLFLNFPWTFCI